MSTIHHQTSESWRPYRPNYGHPTTGHVHEMHPYPYRRYSQHEEAGLVPQLGPRTGSIASMKSNNGGYHSASPPPMNSSNNSKNPSPPPPMATNPMSIPSPPSPAPPVPALYRHNTENTSSASMQMQQQQQQHHRGPSNAATLASSAPTMAYPDTAALRTIPEHDVDSDSDAASRSSSRRRRCCCCCHPCACLGDPPMWLRRLWEYVVLNRCLVYGLIAFVVCSVVFGIVFGVVIPNVAAAGGGGELSVLPSSTGTLPTTTATPTSTAESSTSSTTSATSTAIPLPTNLPQQCQPSRHTTPVSWMGIAGATGGWSFSFSSAESPAECCLHCFTQVDGCNGWQFTPGSATSCTVIEGWEGQKNGDWDSDACPDGVADVQFMKQGQGVREGSAGGAGPCGKVAGSL
ncbi:hypothetical protein PspLS_10266 [Pyricularia sp. CBS 133598]|nr:hypothetical protein PspLS_10266 [Pyricularia sp. CBS 133598]